MRRHSFIALILCAIASTAMAQSFTVYENGKTSGFNEEDVDSIVFSPDKAPAAKPQPRVINARWCSLGTSISWLNENTASYPLTKGYQTRVMEKLAFTKFSNQAVNGGTISSALNAVIMATIAITKNFFIIVLSYFQCAKIIVIFEKDKFWAI